VGAGELGVALVGVTRRSVTNVGGPAMALLLHGDHLTGLRQQVRQRPE
jgi:hypothetical protein